MAFAKEAKPGWAGDGGRWPFIAECAQALLGQVLGRFARRRDPRITGVRGVAEALPFADAAFSAAVAMTSLCFCARPGLALRELWRVSREAVVLGLLHRRSLLYPLKVGRGGYQGARWDQLSEVRAWARTLEPPPAHIEARSALLLPSAGPLARWAERLSGIGQHNEHMPLGGFLAVCLRRSR